MNSRTLLFMEDDKDLQSPVGTFLREKGYRVEPARSAALAREGERSQPHRGVSPRDYGSLKMSSPRDVSTT
ncbi:hypothetical protein [Myxococcus vastator]|uniref:hypothetical protein n=1 Tax=Myxococcus vastator TaxID=2709664 RepID=UPI00196702D9|nr:hypothetical protein [Myxococcus vastator]